MEKIEQCPVCKGVMYTSHLICKDYTTSGESFSLVRCNNCNFIYTNPRPTEDEAGKYYESENYISHQDNKASLMVYIYKIIRKINMRWKLRIINSYGKKGKLLDYGCGIGTFLDAAAGNGWSVTGMDISENARNTAKLRYGLNIVENDAIYKVDEKFDIISLWHVLEHVYDLDGLMKRFYELLNNNGRLLIAVPNCNSRDAKKYKEFWEAYDVPRHIYHFTPDTMTRLCERLGFTVEQTRGMVFDAYFISILSEKRSGKSFSFIRGLYNGLVSNSAARGNHEYSSVLYVIKKK